MRAAAQATGGPLFWTPGRGDSLTFGAVRMCAWRELPTQPCPHYTRTPCGGPAKASAPATTSTTTDDNGDDATAATDLQRPRATATTATH